MVEDTGQGLERKAYGKINLALDVLGKRQDGYHEVKMIMQSVELADSISLKKRDENKITVVTDSHKLQNEQENIAYRAAKIMFEKYQLPGGLKITITKRIPIAAGMAGGSTDAAGVLNAINDLYHLRLDAKALCDIGVKIGADVPYCIIGGTVLAEGIGEKLTPLVEAPDCILLLAKPEMSVSTKYVYEHLDAEGVDKHPDVDGMISAIKNHDLQIISSLTGNVLENVTIKKYPVIQEIKDSMLSEGAMCSLMSGSGPTVFGIFETLEYAEKAKEKIEKRQLANEVFITGFHS